MGFFRAHTAKMQFSHTIPHYIWCNCSYRISPMVNKKMHSNQVTANSFWFDQKRGFFFVAVIVNPHLLKDLKIVLVLTSQRRKYLQVNLCQKLLFLHQLTHNMMTDFSLNYEFSTWKLQAQNMGRTCHVDKLFFVFVLTFRTTYVHNMFYPCSTHVLSLQFSFNEQSFVILWVSWCKNKSFWQRFTCKFCNYFFWVEHPSSTKW